MRKIFGNPEKIKCPGCNSLKIGLAGFTEAETQLYRCKKCGKKFTGTRKTFKNPDELTCPSCNSLKIGLAGFNSSRNRAYYCKDCKRRFTGNRSGKPLLGDKPLTSAEKVRRHRKLKKANERKQ